MAIRRTLYLTATLTAALLLGWPAYLHAENAVHYTSAVAQPGDIVEIDMVMENDVVISGAVIPFRWSSPDISLIDVQILPDRFNGVINESQIAVDPQARTSGVFFVRGTGIFDQGWVNPGSGVLAHLRFRIASTAADQVVYVDSVYEDLGGGVTRQSQYSDFQGTQVIYPSVYSGRIVIGSPVLDIIMEAIPGDLSFRGSELGSDPPPQTLSVQATNSSRFDWEASWTASWLTVTPAAGLAPSFLSVRAATRDLSQGTYRDTIHLAAGEALNSPLAVPVELIVDGPQVRLTAAPENISLEAVRPGADSVAQTIAIAANAVVPIAWTAFASQPWLTLTPETGTTPGFIEVSIDLREFPLGEYNDTVTVVSTVALNSPLRIPVLAILDTAGIKIVARPERLTQTGSVLSNQPRAARLDISSSTGESIDWSLSWTEPWLTLEPTTGRGNANISATFSTAGLEVGIYHDTIAIESPTAKNSPLRVPVDFEVESGSLSQNYPNPFSLYREPRTTIGYYLDEPDRVEIEIYNSLGQRVRTLLSAQRDAGEQSVEWDGRDSTGDLVASGHYFYRMTTSKGTVTKRMTVIK